MKEARPSFTAAFVAACRGLAHVLPADARLVEDPFGARVTGPGASLARHPGPLRRWRDELVLYMQVRTRTFDDVVARFVDAGGTQVVILGAGYDTRAARLARGGVRFFEVDHPATQGAKRALVGAGAGGVTYLAWDFEQRAIGALPAALAEAGLQREQRVLTIWEGVTMYLSEGAIDASVRAVRDYSAAGSQLAFNYIERSAMERPRNAFHRLVRVFVAAVGEPFTFGFDSATLPVWLHERGFALDFDKSMVDLGKELLPPQLARDNDAIERRICVATAR